MHMDCAFILSLVLSTLKKLKSTRGTSASYVMLILSPTFKSRIQSNVMFMCKRHHVIHQHHINLKFTGLQVLLLVVGSIITPFPTGSACLSQDDRQPL